MKKKIIAKDRDSLIKLIKSEIIINGYYCNLNYIDVSQVEDMNYLFYCSKFNGNISNWDVSNVTNMNYMFAYSKFNGDIVNWDISNVISISNIFYNCLCQKPVLYNENEYERKILIDKYKLKKKLEKELLKNNTKSKINKI